MINSIIINKETGKIISFTFDPANMDMDMNDKVCESINELIEYPDELENIVVLQGNNKNRPYHVVDISYSFTKWYFDKTFKKN